MCDGVDDSIDDDYETSLYARDKQDRVLRLNSNYEFEVLDALERLAPELERTKTDLDAWQWAIIYAHNAAQNAMAAVVPVDATETWGRLGKIGSSVLMTPNGLV